MRCSTNKSEVQIHSDDGGGGDNALVEDVLVSPSVSQPRQQREGLLLEVKLGEGMPVIIVGLVGALQLDVWVGACLDMMRRLVVGK